LYPEPVRAASQQDQVARMPVGFHRNVIVLPGLAQDYRPKLEYRRKEGHERLTAFHRYGS